ncbi:uncharacterized protein OCT59_014132 [Rhizophagus irregularis]|uniref:Uncharacterized protein n=1 Tax=Rhizophagus irregularis (strain DAOM 181602 / DAOM 197198 / MUCL 43194) TaxID=747089 RepID=U9V830_RHIID|nr:hypothetical protein OCT59_014132 [Rhizophagus irregularis]
MPHISGEFYRAGATILSPEAIQEIKNSRGRIPNAAKAMASKYHIHLVVSMTSEDPLITHNDEKKTKKSSEEKLKPKSGRKKTSTSSIVTQPVNSNTTSHLAIVPTRTVHSEGTTFTSWAKSKHYTR